MADFIVDEDDENGAPLRWCSSYILEPQTVSSSVFFSFITNNHLILYICNLDLLTVWCRRRKLKKKKSRQAPGVSSTALQEAHEIFGDVDELLQLRKRELDTHEWREKRLEDEFEPIVISEKYMTEKDDQIREIDIPERMQVLFYSILKGFIILLFF